MPYVSPQLLDWALDALGYQHPLLLFSLPCMTRKGLPTCVSQLDADARGMRYGGADERRLLNEYFRVAGAPAETPYFSPSTGGWIAERYAETSLQRQRKDKAKPTAEQIFYESGDRGNRAYALKDGLAPRISADMLRDGPVSLLAYGAWVFRQEPFDSLEAIVEQVVHGFDLDRDDLVGTVYRTSTRSIDWVGALAADPLSDEAIFDALGVQRRHTKREIALQLGGARQSPPPPARRLDSMKELVERIEVAMEDENVVLASGVVARVMRAWLAQDIVVLVGAPGTGKTTFASEFARACEACIPALRATEEVLVDPDFDNARLLGYVDLAGELQPTGFTRRVLHAEESKQPQIVLLEEWNTAQVEAYLGQILHAVESEGRKVQLADGSKLRLPLDTLFVATCNSVRDEPETRLPISRPTKRRTTVIEMPNILFDAWEDGGREAIVAQADSYLRYSRDKVASRRDDAPVLDELRSSLLEGLESVNDLPDLARETLLDVVEFLFGTPEGRQFMTIGLLVDVLQDLAFAEDGAAEALGWCITGKLLEQVSTMEVARGLAEQAAGLPSGGDVLRAVEAMDMKDGGSVANPLL